VESEKKWRWWDTKPENDLVETAAATEYALLLADYAREFFTQAKHHPPVGFILKDNGGVIAVPDLEDIPREMWKPSLMFCCLTNAADMFVLIAEAHVLVTENDETAKKVLSGAKISEIETSREGVLLVLSTIQGRPIEMLFMPRDGDGLGPVETPGPAAYQ